MTEYPLVIRNIVALYLRCFMLAFVAIDALITRAAFQHGPPEPDRWWPLILAGFWALGLCGLVHAMNQETSVLRVTRAGDLRLVRGKAFRRVEHHATAARFWIEETKDGDGDPYFKLMIDAPDGPLAVKEGHRRARIEALQRRVEAALLARSAEADRHVYRSSSG